MRQLFAVILEKDKDAVTRALLETGVIHFIDIRELSAEWTSSLEEHRPEGGGEKAKELRRRLEGFFHSAGINPSKYMDMRAEEELSVAPEEAEKVIEGIASKVRKTREKQKELQDELLRLKEIERRLPSDGIDYTRLEGSHSYLSIHFGTVGDKKRDLLESSLKDYPSVYIKGEGGEEERVDYLLTLRRDESRVLELLKKLGWEERKPPKKSGKTGETEKNREGEVLAVSQTETLPASHLKEKQQKLSTRQKELEESAEKIVADRAEELSRLWAAMRVRELSFEVERFYRKTDRTYLLSGWIPKERMEEVSRAIMGSCEGKCRIEWHNPADTKDPEVSHSAPVQMHNPKFLGPFQKLVENYAVPAYGTVDPTPFVAVFYLAMFGLMFGDVGHGGVVFLAGLIGKKVLQRRGKESMLFPLFIWCGCAAMAAGVLFGSCFGMSLLPPLWFDYHGVVAGHGGGGVESIEDILLITIYFGITVISVGLLLNWINRIRLKDWFALVWKEGGLIVGWLYAAGTYCAFYFVRHDYSQLPEGKVLMLLVGVPVLLLAVKPYLEHRRGGNYGTEAEGGSPEKAQPATFIMEWLVELLEIFSGYLSNTLSFMRVAGLGIAHVSLMTAFFQIADMAAGGGTYTIASYLILLAGNALVIGLEGLSAGVQSLRLNYYEFFSKYFSGTGKAYSPVSLKGGVPSGLADSTGGKA
ncbi:MAG: V-type ATP synthase subunit I [Spirochaetaceae bacterium]